MYARYIPPSTGQTGPRASGSGAAQQPTAAPAPAAANLPAAQPPADGFSYSRYIPGAKPASKQVAAASIQYFDEEQTPPNPKRKRDVADETQESILPDKRKSKKAKGDADTPVREETSTQLPNPITRPDGTVKLSKKERKDRKKENKKKGWAVDEPEENPDTTETNQVEIIPEAEDEKESKKKHRDATREDEEPELLLNGEDSQAQASEEKAEKKRKKEKKKKSEATPVEEASEGEEDMRHKALLDRRAKSLKFASKHAKEEDDDESEAEEELHGLEALPQPEPAEADSSKPSYDTLPSWLAAPIRVSQDTRTPFTDLGILPKAARILQEKGYPEAFAVQTAAVPLLLPTSKQRPGDILISAATGSGKTLAYALPIVRDISQGVVTRLRALVVLPTRELVKQAEEVFELCAKAYEGTERKRVRIGVAIGSQAIKTEQGTLMECETRYDPEAYKQIQEQTRQERHASASTNLDSIIDDDAEDTDPRLGTWDGQVVDFSSKVDVLICTPGRLVEHIEQTPGFSLDYVRWLVVDEADKLLAQSFQGWLDTVMDKFQTNKFSARDFPDMQYSGVRKVVLSATLTRDLSLLSQLALRRPRLIVLENEGEVQVAEHTLPGTLKEYAIRVHETNLKPLYLLDLLWSQDMKAMSRNVEQGTTTETAEQTESDSSSNSSDSDSDSDSDATSDSGSDTSSDADSDSDADATSRPKPMSRKGQIPISLIFTKSNESALRLSRLLTLLDKSLATQISTLTSTTPTHIRRKTLRAFTTPSSPVRLIIASDLVARGIDIPQLGHVINYDLPPSVASYVHRVGRTARAGREGCAWTLVGDDESGWFWGKIAKGAGVRRPQKVGRVRIEEMGEERVKDYEGALESLGREALEKRRK